MALTETTPAVPDPQGAGPASDRRGSNRWWRRAFRHRLVRHWRPVLAWAGVLPVAAWTLLRLSGTGNWFPAVQVLAFTPYLLPVAVLVAAVSGLSRRWVALVVAAACLAALAVVVLPRAFGQPDAAAGGPRLRLLSANMLVGTADVANLVALVRAHEVDLLALQEFTAPAQERLRAAGLEDVLPYHATYPADLPGGSALYSRYPLSGTGYRPLPPFFGQAFAVLHLPDGETIRVESAHPCAPSAPDRTPGWRAGQAMQPHADSHAGPQILVGDFNATLDHAPMRELLATGYADVAARLGDGLTPTWPFDGDPVPGVTLDHVLVAGLRAYAFATYPNPGSDHRAIYAEVGLPG